MKNSVCTTVRSLKNRDEMQKLESEVKLASSILDAVTDKFWKANPTELVNYITEIEGQFEGFELLKVNAEEIQMHLHAFKEGNESIDDTRLWMELFAEDVRKAKKQLKTSQ